MKTYEEYLRDCAVPKEVVDSFLDPDKNTWVQFDPEVGYILSNAMLRDGIDGSSTILTVRPNGTRAGGVYARRPCRINTYGDSFTQSAQVSDQETWQEYLAGHLGEPIRNYGVGGFGVYQAYRRMLRAEESEDGARYIILYIWGDDHFRSCMRCRYVVTRRWHQQHDPSLFHGNFWSNVEIDLESGGLVERDSLLPTPESLYRMTEPDFMVEALRDDLMAQMYVMLNDSPEEGPVTGFSLQKLDRLAEILGCRAIPSSPSGSGPAEECRRRVEALRNAYGFAATRYILDKTAEFTESREKELMVALFCPTATRGLIEKGARYDQPVADHIAARGIRCFDMNLVHAKDYQCFDLPFSDYWKRYSIGHYNPAGNHFFAYSIRPMLVDWLDPKPIPYQNDGAKVHFAGYLPTC